MGIGRVNEKNEKEIEIGFDLKKKKRFDMTRTTISYLRKCINRKLFWFLRFNTKKQPVWFYLSVIVY